jgi:eukaryotic-like serine/threonine-protein kinase
MRDVLPSASRYELLVKVAAGGMATVYVGRTRSAGAGIRRLFAIKRAHAHLLDDPVFRKMFVAEARLASKIHHPNVVAVQDVEELPDELLLVMDYVEGIALSDLRENAVDARAATRIVLDACAGLHAAHELVGDDGEPLAIVHRDVSPHNILVGTDGIARLTDFGIAKSTVHTSGATATGGLKGKLGYMAPEYVETGKADRRADVFALGAVLWECLTGERLFQASTELELMKQVARCEVIPPSQRLSSSPADLDDVVTKALARSPDDRFASAADFAEALESAARKADLLGTHRDVAKLVDAAAKDTLETRRAAITERIEGPTSEISSGSFEYEGHDRTATLDPTVNAASAAPRESKPALASTSPPPPKPRTSLVLGGLAVVIAIGVVRMLTARDLPPSEPASSAPTPASTSAAAPASAPAPAHAHASASASATASAPASASPSSAPPPKPPSPLIAQPASTPRAPKPTAAPSSPSSPSAPSAPSAPPTEPEVAPLQAAPPNPYKRRDAGT